MSVVLVLVPAVLTTAVVAAVRVELFNLLLGAGRGATLQIAPDLLDPSAILLFALASLLLFPAFLASGLCCVVAALCVLLLLGYMRS